MAEKVGKYVDVENPTIFDGAVGSGQLEQFINPSKVYGVDIQEQSVSTARQNYKNTDLEIKSFFNYTRGDFITDAVVMNPPFSIEFKSLSDEEKKNIQKEFEWKKSGKVDDIFVLKSLKYTKRFGFYILFPGVCYRKTEEKFRELIGNSLAELNLVRNAFDDTSIEVIFIVVDKEKTKNTIEQEIYDCKLKKVLESEKTEFIETKRWELPHEVHKNKKINIEKVNEEIEDVSLQHFINGLRIDLCLIVEMNADIDIMGKIKKRKKILKDFEKEAKEALDTGKTKYKIEELKLF